MVLRRTPRQALTLPIALALACCAAPPLRLYTLSDRANAPASPLGARPTVIAIERVSLPGEIDNEDILVRDGSAFRRSAKGRWASQLSLQVTDLLARRLAQRHPDALVTEGAEAGIASYRLRIRIVQLDVQADGSAHVAADWMLIASTPTREAAPRRTEFTLRGSVMTDDDVVALEKAGVERLADEIGLADIL